MISKSPGTTFQPRSISSNWRSSGVSFKETVLVFSGINATLFEPAELLDGGSKPG